MVDAFAYGSLNNKTPEEAMQLIETMAANNYSTPNQRGMGKRGVMELNTLDAILIQNKALSQQLAYITKQLGQVQIGAINSLILVCLFVMVTTDGACETITSQEQVNYMETQTKVKRGEFCHIFAQ